MSYAHVGFNVKDFAASKEFYAKALAPLGYKILGEGKGWANLSADGKTGLWIGTFGEAATPIHLAFVGETQEQVDAFYAAALGAGGKDNGAPGIRENYAPDYYAAFVIDPDGHNIEVVHRAS